MKAIGINIYGGGFTLGVKQAGWDVLGQWEEITLGKRTFDLNFPGLFRPLKMSDWPIKDYAGQVPFVYANPPCAPWSIANNHKGKTRESRFQDKRLELTSHTMRTALVLRPSVFISESVEAAYNIGASHYDQFVEMWMAAGYSVTYFLTDALLHGAPCRRQRFHFIAHQHKLMLGDVPRIENPRTVRDAIGDLGDDFGKVPQHDYRPAPGYEYLMPQVPPGGKLCVVINNTPDYKGPKAGFLVRRLYWDSVSPTMVGFTFIHPNGHRWITYREAMRLCTYPDTFLAHSPVEAVDAVLPIVAKFLATVARDTIESKKRCSQEFQVVDWRPHGKPFHIGHVLGKFDYEGMKNA